MPAKFDHSSAAKVRVRSDGGSASSRCPTPGPWATETHGVGHIVVSLGSPQGTGISEDGDTMIGKSFGQRHANNVANTAKKGQHELGGAG